MVKIKVIKGDITKQTVDAIVNAANSSLLIVGEIKYMKQKNENSIEYKVYIGDVWV